MVQNHSDNVEEQNHSENVEEQYPRENDNTPELGQYIYNVYDVTRERGHAESSRRLIRSDISAIGRYNRLNSQIHEAYYLTEYDIWREHVTQV